MIEGNSTIKISEVLNGEVVKIAGLEKIAENPEKFLKIKIPRVFMFENKSLYNILRKPY